MGAALARRGRTVQVTGAVAAGYPMVKIFVRCSEQCSEDAEAPVEK